MLDHIVVGLYLLVTVVGGFRGGRGIEDMEDYSTAYKQYPTSILIATSAATLIGAENVFSLTEKIFEAGIIYWCVCIALPLCTFLVASVIVPRMSRFRYMISVGDIMGEFYGKVGKMVTGLSGFLLSIGFVGAQVCAMGYLCSYLYNIPAVYGAIVGAGIVTVYSAIGGIRSVTYTGVIQMVVLVIAIPIISNAGLHKCGGYTQLFEAMPASHFSVVTDDKSMLYYCSLFVILFIPFMDPALVQRILMTRNDKKAKQTFYSVAVIQFVFHVVIGVTGLAAIVLLPSINPHDIIPYFVKYILPAGMKGLVVAGLLAIIMSTAGSYLNTGSICFAHDFVKPIFGERLKDGEELMIARFVAVFIGIASIIVALMKQSIMDIIFMFCNFWVPVVVVPLITGLFGYRKTQKAFIYGMIAGVLTCFLWIFFVENMVGIGALIPSLLANIIIFFMVDRKQLTKIILPRLTTVTIPSGNAEVICMQAPLGPDYKPLLNPNIYRRVDW